MHILKILILKVFTFRFNLCFVGLPAVITLSMKSRNDKTTDGVPIGEACKRLEDDGAAVVGLNCGRGPATMIEPLKQIRQACKVGAFKALISSY